MMKIMILLSVAILLSGCIIVPVRPSFEYRYQQPPYYPYERYRDDGMDGMHTPEEYDQPTDLKRRQPPLNP